MKDDCYPGCRSPRVRLVCPMTGTLAPCDEARNALSPHVREEWAPAGARIRCETHSVLLVQQVVAS